MGQKVNPHGMRVGVIKDWDSRWYARDEKVGDLIVEDYKIRQYLKTCIPQASRTSRSSATARRSASISTALVRALSSARAARRSSASASPSRR